MKPALLAALVALIAAAAAPAHAQTSPCPPAGYDRARIEALRASEWTIPSVRERERVALAIAACVASPDPFWRDSIAFEGLTHLLRAGALRPAVRDRLTHAMLAHLANDDAQGFEAPFAALVLSELVRADRLSPAYTPAQRGEIAAAATAFLANVRDYRGFDEQEGWRHGVAHGADVLMQIALNPAFDDLAQLRAMRDAVGAQIAPERHFYIYGEPDRLMRPILFLARRGAFSEDEWRAWFAALARRDGDAFASQAGLAWRHNTIAFLQAVWLNARLSEDQSDDVLLAPAEAALRAMP